MPAFQGSLAINLIGTLARVINSDGSWTVFHSDVGGLSFDATNGLQGTIRWIVRTTASPGGFAGATELQAYGGLFDQFAINASTFMTSSLAQRHDLLFNRTGVVLNGDASGNLLAGGNGADIFNGFGGSDTVSYEQSATGVVTALDGSLTQFGEATGDVFVSIENLQGSALADRLVGDINGNVLAGNGGDDFLVGRGGDDLIFAGDGDDTVVGGGGNDTLSGGFDQDVLSYRDNISGVFVTLNPFGAGQVDTGTIFGVDEFNGFEGIEGGAGGDNLVGNQLSNQIFGVDGNDFLVGAEGDDNLFGGLGNDTLIGGTGNDTIQGGGGVDMLGFDLGAVVGVNVVLDNVGAGFAFMSTGGFDRFFGITNVTGSIGSDSITGNDSSNVLRGYSGDDTVYGESGDDSVGGGIGNDVLFGDYNWNFKKGNLPVGNDTVSGEDGNDRLVGGLGNDSLNGGTGRDMADYSNLFEDQSNGTYFIQANLQAGTVQKFFWDIFGVISAQGTDLLSNLFLSGLINQIEDITGTYGNDRIIGSAFGNVILGGYGADSIDGGSGNDVLAGEAGSDTLSGGLGDDKFYIDATDTLNEAVNNGTDTVLIAGSYTLTQFFENLVLMGNAAFSATGNDSDNVLTGNGGNNTLIGLAGADTLMGGAGNDWYQLDAADIGVDQVVEAVGGGTDTVFSTATVALMNNVENLVLAGQNGVNGVGNTLGNTVTGSSFNNAINGREGQDVLTGGGGADAFLFSTALGPTNVDTITDFAPGQDIIRLDDAIFAGLALGILGAGAFTSNTTGLATGAAAQIIYETDTGFLWFDANGIGGPAAQHFATLAPALALSQSSFAVF